MRYELKKLLGFREMWIGSLLFTAYLLFGIIMDSSKNQDWPLIFQFISRFGGLIFPGFLVIGLSRLFCYEYSEHTDVLIHACKNGSKTSFQDKIAASAIYTICSAAFFTTLALIAYLLPLGTGGDTFSVDVKYTVFSIQNIGIYAVQVLLMIIGGLTLVGFILLMSTLLKRGAVVMIICGGFYGLLLIFDTFSHRLTGRLIQVIGSILEYGPVKMISLAGFGCEDIWAFESNFSNAKTISVNIIIPSIVIIAVTAIELYIANIIWKRRAAK